MEESLVAKLSEHLPFRHLPVDEPDFFALDDPYGDASRASYPAFFRIKRRHLNTRLCGAIWVVLNGLCKLKNLLQFFVWLATFFML